MKRIVVAGGGPAGLRAVQTLREHGFEGELTLVCEERHRPYQRPPLSKELLAGTVEAEACRLRCEDTDWEWRLGTRATGIDVERRIVRLGDGEQLPYDGLIIATGRRPRPWPAKLPDLEGFFTLRTLDDCLALREATRAGPRVAIVGAGFIGCEVAATLRSQGLEVTLLEQGELPMPALGAEAGRRAIVLHQRKGVELRLGVAVEGFDGDGRVEVVKLSGGAAVDADLVLLSLGAVPNSEWLADTELELRRGSVLVDEHCTVAGHPEIVAVGDVAAWPHPHAPGPVSVEHWTNAGEMAEAAAANLLREPGERTAFRTVPTFWSDQYDVKIKSAGLFGHADRVEVVEEDDGEKWRLVMEGHRDDTLVGAVTFNKNRAFIDYRRRIEAALADA